MTIGMNTSVLSYPICSGMDALRLTSVIGTARADQVATVGVSTEISILPVLETSIGPLRPTLSFVLVVTVKLVDNPRAYGSVLIDKRVLVVPASLIFSFHGGIDVCVEIRNPGVCPAFSQLVPS